MKPCEFCGGKGIITDLTVSPAREIPCEECSEIDEDEGEE